MYASWFSLELEFFCSMFSKKSSDCCMQAVKEELAVAERIEKELKDEL